MFHPEYINPSKLVTNADILKLFELVEKHGGVLRFVGGAVFAERRWRAHIEIYIKTPSRSFLFRRVCRGERF